MKPVAEELIRRTVGAIVAEVAEGRVFYERP